MEFLLEAGNGAGVAPVNIAIGIIVFMVLVAAMAVLHGIGASRPHS